MGVNPKSGKSWNFLEVFQGLPCAPSAPCAPIAPPSYTCIIACPLSKSTLGPGILAGMCPPPKSGGHLFLRARLPSPGTHQLPSLRPVCPLCSSPAPRVPHKPHTLTSPVCSSPTALRAPCVPPALPGLLRISFPAPCGTLLASLLASAWPLTSQLAGLLLTTSRISPVVRQSRPCSTIAGNVYYVLRSPTFRVCSPCSPPQNSSIPVLPTFGVSDLTLPNPVKQCGQPGNNTPELPTLSGCYTAPLTPSTALLPAHVLCAGPPVPSSTSPPAYAAS